MRACTASGMSGGPCRSVHRRRRSASVSLRGSGTGRGAFAPVQAVRAEDQTPDDEAAGEVLTVLRQRGLQAAEPVGHRDQRLGGRPARGVVQQPVGLLKSLGQLPLPCRRARAVLAPPYLADHRLPAVRPPRHRIMPGGRAGWPPRRRHHADATAPSAARGARARGEVIREGSEGGARVPAPRGLGRGRVGGAVIVGPLRRAPPECAEDAGRGRLRRTRVKLLSLEAADAPRRGQTADATGSSTQIVLPRSS